MIEVRSRHRYKRLNFVYGRFYAGKRLFHADDITNDIVHVTLLSNDSSVTSLADKLGMSIGGAVTAGVTGLVTGMLWGKRKFQIDARIHLNDGTSFDIYTNDKAVIKALLPHMRISRRR